MVLICIKLSKFDTAPASINRPLCATENFKLGTISVVKYEVTFSINENKEAGTEDTQFVKISGSDGESTETRCEANFSVPGSDVSCSFYSAADIGTFKCVSVRTGGSDELHLNKVC